MPTHGPQQQGMIQVVEKALDVQIAPNPGASTFAGQPQPLASLTCRAGTRKSPGESGAPPGAPGTFCLPSGLSGPSPWEYPRSGCHHDLSESLPSARAVESNSRRTSDSKACKGCSANPSQTPQWTPHPRRQHPIGLNPLIGLPYRLLGNTKRLCLTQRLLPGLVDPHVRLIDTTPSLHPRYGTSTLLRVVPPLCPASVLSPLWVFPLGFLP